MDNCIFCKIIKKEIPSAIVYEDNNVFAFKDIHPQSKHHILVVPKEHIAYINESTTGQTLNNVFNAINKIAVQEGFSESGYRVCVNNGPDAGQTVFHVHFHVLGGQRLSDNMV